MEFFKTRSKALIISTLFSIIAGTTAIFNSLYGIWNAFTPDGELMTVLSIVTAWPIFALIFCGIALVCGIFCVFTAWRALKTNKKSYHISNVILNIVTFFLGIPLLLFSVNEEMMEPVVEYSLYALILRLFGYFNQKKIDKKNNKEEEKNEFNW